MPISIIQQPPGLILSGNPAWYKILAAQPGDLITAVVRLGITEIGRDYAHASINSHAHFELSEYFDTALNPQCVSLSEDGPMFGYELDPDIMAGKIFTIEFLDDESNSTDTSHMVIKGATNIVVNSFLLTHIKYDSFYEFISNNLFLHLKPDSIHVKYPNQPERLYFPIYKGDLLSDISVKRNIHFLDGSTLSDTATTLSSHQVGDIYYIKTSYAAFVSPAITEVPENPVLMYDIQLYIGASEISPKYNYIVDFLPNKAHLHTFLFLNPVGGFDTLCASGRHESIIKTEKQLSTLVTDHSAIQKLYRVSSREMSCEYSVNTGFISNDSLTWISQMMHSDTVYKVIDNLSLPGGVLLIPVLFLPNKINVVEQANDLLSANLSYLYNLPNRAEIHP